MDNQKDTIKEYNGQSGILPKRQLTSAHSPVNVLKSVNDFDEINHEISYSFLSKKTEKLSSALYLITGFLSDSEPMKWKLREAGLSVLSDVGTLGSAAGSEIALQVKKIMSDIEKTVSLLEISATAGFLSEMNLSVLKEEYLSLIQTLAAKKRGGLQESFVFSRDFFTVRTLSLPENENTNKGHIKDNETESPIFTPTIQPKKEEGRSAVVAPSDGVSDLVRNVSSVSSSIEKSNTPKVLEKNSRRENIIALVREKSSVDGISIKDITTHFTDCGEKTIQRELSLLVDTKVLKKTGDRRWSKYSLI